MGAVNHSLNHSKKTLEMFLFNQAFLMTSIIAMVESQNRPMDHGMATHGPMDMVMPKEDCCIQKMVGSISYTLLEGPFQGQIPHQCLNDCVYTVSGTSSPKFCFGRGHLPTKCLPGTCKCGIKKTSRIVGGTETEVNEYPWIAAFDFSGTSGTSPGGCAATLVANNWAVTASHCFYNTEGVLTVTKDTMSLVLGVHDLTGTTDTNRQVLTIEEIVIHPSFNFSDITNDIALLKLTPSVDLDAWSPACLPKSGADFTGQNGWVYGWGVTSEEGEYLADKLLELEVPIVSNSVCATAMSSHGNVTSGMLCAGGENGRDACGGDSGGPLTVANSTSGAHTLVGAVSFGVGCAREGLYGVYADVSFFRTWIDETIAAKGGATFCS